MSNRNTGFAWRACLLTLGVCAFGPSASAALFANEDLSLSGMGAGNAMIAGAYDASAAAYNPAAIAWLEGVQLRADPVARYRNNSLRVPGALLPNMADAPDAVSTHLAWMPQGGDFGMGFSLSTPFHNVTMWSPGMPAVPDDWLQVRRASLDLVYVVNSTLSVAHGVDYYYAKTHITQGALSFAGKDKASFGAHVGLSWKFLPRWRLGMMLRKAPRLQLTDRVRLRRIDLPDQLGLGISHDTHDRLRWELDVEWTRWSALKDAGVTDGAATLIAVPLSLRDTVAVRAGLNWFWRRDSVFRFGYAYDQGANQTSAFQPVFSDQPGHRLTVGMGGEMFDIHLDLAYAYTFYAQQKVTGAYAGKYRDRRQSLGVAFSKSF